MQRLKKTQYNKKDKKKCQTYNLFPPSNTDWLFEFLYILKLKGQISSLQ